MSGRLATDPPAGFGVPRAPRANPGRRWRWVLLVAVAIIVVLVLVATSGLGPTRTPTGLDFVRIVPSYTLPLVVPKNLSIVFCNDTGPILVEAGNDWACAFTITDQDWDVCIESITEAGASMVFLAPGAPLTIPAGASETFTLTISTPTSSGVTVDLNVSIDPKAGVC